MRVRDGAAFTVIAYSPLGGMRVTLGPAVTTFRPGRMLRHPAGCPNHSPQLSWPR